MGHEIRKTHDIFCSGLTGSIVGYIGWVMQCGMIRKIEKRWGWCGLDTDMKPIQNLDREVVVGG